MDCAGRRQCNSGCPPEALVGLGGGLDTKGVQKKQNHDAVRRYPPPVQGGLLDREAALRLVESARQGVFCCFFVVQRGMDRDLPGKRERDSQAQKMRRFFFYSILSFFFFVSWKPIVSLYLTASSPEGREKVVSTERVSPTCGQHTQQPGARLPHFVRLCPSL